MLKFTIMKKYYYFILLTVFLTPKTYCQFYEGFESPELPNQTMGTWSLDSGIWAIADNGVGLGQSWSSVSSINSPTTPQLVFAGNASGYMNRENIGVGNTSEDWLISPLAAVNTNDLLRFQSRTTIAGDQGTIYEIRVSTASQTDISSFTTVASWTESNMNQVFNIYEEKTVSLAAYTGQSIYVAFVMSFTQPTTALGGDRWLIDNLSVGDPNAINGTVFITSEGTACESSTPLPNIRINAVENSLFSTVPSNSDGNYQFSTYYDSVTITPDLNPAYFAITPASYELDFSTIANNQTANFCVSPIGIRNDLEIVLVPYGPARPGFDANYKLLVKNIGNQAMSASISFDFDDATLDFVSAQPAVSTQATGMLSWNFFNLAIGENRHIDIVLNLNSPTETPAVNIGDELNFTAIVTPVESDETPLNNESALKQVVTGSYDPNDKIVTEGETISPEETGNFLHYLIRFQNTGTSAAEKILVRDILEGDLDPTTTQVISSSHPFSSKLLDGNRLEFSFDNINLPPSSIDEPGSNGFIAFKIKPKSNVGEGSVITNSANIFFDYNFPITTNTVTTTVSSLGIGGFTTNVYTIYPNPARNTLTISAELTQIDKVEIYNMIGQLVYSNVHVAGNSVALDVSNLSDGTYLSVIYSADGKSTKKFIKL